MSGLKNIWQDNLVVSKKSIDAFYDLQTKGVVYEDSRRYLYAERDLCSAIASLSEYVGMMLTDDFLTDKSEKSA